MAPELRAEPKADAARFFLDDVPAPSVTLSRFAQASTDAERRAVVEGFITRAMEAFATLDEGDRWLHTGAPEVSADDYEALDSHLERFARAAILAAEDLVASAQTLDMPATSYSALRRHAINWRFMLDWDIPPDTPVPEREPLPATEAELAVFAEFEAALAAGEVTTISSEEMARRLEDD